MLNWGQKGGTLIMEYRPKSLVIVRHAQSIWNAIAPSHRGQVTEAPPEMKGISDPQTPLTEEGNRQALETGKALEKLFGGFDTVYHSPWLRTTQTAQKILEGFSESARTYMQIRCFRNLFLMEQRFGDLDIGIGDPEDIHEKYNEFYERRKAAGKLGKFYIAPPNGESWADVCMRTHQFLDIIFRPNRDRERILIVTHGITTQTFRYHLERMDEEQLVEEYGKEKPKNCGVSYYEWDEIFPRYVLKFWNKTFYETPTE